MNTRELFTEDCRMILDEIENTIFDQLLNGAISDQDEAAVRELISLIYKFLNISIDCSTLPLDQCFPEFNILDIAETSTPSTFSSLLSSLETITISDLKNEDLKMAIMKILSIGKQEVVLAEKPSSASPRFFAVSEELWRAEIKRKFNLESEQIKDMKYEDESYRDLYKRLLKPQQPSGCYLVILKTNGDDPIAILNQATQDFFREGKLFKSYADANDFVFTQPILGRPLCIELNLSLEDAKSKLKSKQEISPFIKKVNNFPVTIEKKQFKY